MTTPAVAWYREPWPWLLMVMPAIALVSGFTTLWLAVTSNNSLVVDDYYREGKAINLQIARDQAALAHGVQASLTLGVDGASVRLRAADGMALPAALAVRLFHPTEAQLDRSYQLSASGGGLYAVHDPRPAPATVRWRVQIEPQGGDWRLVGSGSDFTRPLVIGAAP